MENKKNTAILSVIAIATLLVAVVGATFAFFAVQGGTAATKTITVQTYTSDSTTFSIDRDLAISADQSNFGEGAGSLVSGANAEIAFRPASRESEGLCYNLKLVVSSNTFDYSATNGSCSDSSYTTKAECTEHSATWNGTNAELTLDVIKGGTLTTATDVAAHCSDNSNKTEQECVEPNTWVPATTKVTGISAGASGTVIYNALDITKLAAGTYYIPTSSSNSISTTRIDHTIPSSASSEVNENFAFLVTFVNLNSNQTDVAGEAFSGQLVLAKCPTE